SIAALLPPSTTTDEDGMEVMDLPNDVDDGRQGNAEEEKELKRSVATIASMLCASTLTKPTTTSTSKHSTKAPLPLILADSVKFYMPSACKPSSPMPSSSPPPLYLHLQENSPAKPSPFQRNPPQTQAQVQTQDATPQL
ncbi:hypothetical protein H0H87_003775, partial [Tephrocybe sp. NHM501043]